MRSLFIVFLQVLFEYFLLFNINFEMTVMVWFLSCISTDFSVINLCSEFMTDENIVESMASFVVQVMPRPLMYVFVWKDCIGDDKTVVVTEVHQSCAIPISKIKVV